MSFLRSKVLLVFGIVVVLGLLGFSLSFYGKTASAEALAHGLVLAKSADYAGAEKQFRKAVLWNPKNWEAYVELAISLERQNKFEDAYWILSKAEKRFGKDDLRIKSEKGKVARYLSNETESEALLKEVIAKRPQDGLAHYRLGHVYFIKGDYEAARQEYFEAVKLYPLNAQFRTGLGAAQAMLGDEEAALAAFNIALRLDPNYPGAHNNLADIYNRRKEYNLALEHADKAVNLNPNKADYLLTRAEIYEAKGEIEKAKQDLKTALDILVSAPPSAAGLRVEIENKLKSF